MPWYILVRKREAVNPPEYWWAYSHSGLNHYVRENYACPGAWVSACGFVQLNWEKPGNGDRCKRCERFALKHKAR